MFLKEGISEPKFYGDLVNKFRRIVSNTLFRNNSKKEIAIVTKNIGYNTNVMRQTGDMIFKPNMVESFISHFNCMAVKRATD